MTEKSMTPNNRAWKNRLATIPDFASTTTVNVRRFLAKTDTQCVITEDRVLNEVPIALVYNGISHVVLMATPTDLVAFAVGFTLSENIASLAEIFDIEVMTMSQNIDKNPTPQGIQIDIQLSSRAFEQLKVKRRNLVGRTGCGVCGIESLTQVDTQPSPITTPFDPNWLTLLPVALDNLHRQQPNNQLTGSAHAAAWIVEGNAIQVCEDVGRHNALDKLLGYLAIQGEDVSNGFVLMTSRASFELVSKCSRFNIALLACISAPTSLAVQMATQANMGLLGFCRGEKFVAYHLPTK